MKVDIKKLKKTSMAVFKDCIMPNGAFVAAPVHQPYYPKDASNYMLVWPGRDAGFNLAAMYLSGNDFYPQVLEWIWNRAEDFQYSRDKSHEGILFRNYYLNGRIYLHYFQPDQNGTLLWSIGFKHQLKKHELTTLEKKVLNKAASALVRVWHKDHFSLSIEDLWEERGIREKKGILTYSLAACATGLESAGKLLKNRQYLQISKQMKETLHKYCWDEKNQIISRRFFKDKAPDSTSDASLAGLVWPFNIGFPKDHLLKTIDKIESKLVTNKGVYRYPQDRYEGSLGNGHNHENNQAGSWPLLTFWLAIAFNELGDTKKAKKYFNLVFNNIKNDYYIPEQIFCCRQAPWVGIKPLVWSHSKALLAAWKLKI